MIAQGLEISLHMTFVGVHQARHESITVEHLLLALLSNSTAAEVPRACAANIEGLHTHLKNFTTGNTPVVPGTDEVGTQSTFDFQRMIQRAIMHVQSTSNGKEEATDADVLMVIFGKKDSYVVYHLRQQGVTRLDVINFISHGIRKNQAKPAKQGGGNPEDEGGDSKESPLEQLIQNLNALTKAGKIDPLIGREQEVERVVQVLCHHCKNNPLLMGEADVSKAAIAEGLARHITKGKVSGTPAKSVVYPLDTGTLLTGTKYHGDFEQRLKGVLKSSKDNPNAILFIDEIHTLINTGAASGDTLDASDLLRPALPSGTLRRIGATTFTKYRGIFEEDAALSRRFREVGAVEPTVDQTAQILCGLKSHFEEHHDVKYALSALTATAELSARFITDRHLLDKAVDVINEVGVAQHILPESEQRKTIGKGEIEVIVSCIACIPLQSASQDDHSKLWTLECDLESVVLGQDPVIDALVSAIRMSRAGLGKTGKLISSFLFSDPADAGKTEIAKQLTLILGIELIRLGMSEYMERHAMSWPIGAPLSYMGFNQDGLLTEAVTKKPHYVLLLGEIERAYLDVFNILLQVMGHGALTGNNGRKADFHNVIITMTANTDAETMNRAAIGFITTREQGGEMADIKRMSTPGFRNRPDATISFRPLDEEIIIRMVDRSLMQLEEQLHKKEVDTIFTEKLHHFLAKKGLNLLMGTCPTQHLIQDLTRETLADELLFGKLVSGGRAVVDLGDADAVKLEFSENGAPPAPAREGAEA